MQELVTIILASGRTAVELALFLLLPVMVVMMALMKALEGRGVLTWAARLLAPPLRVFGLPGAGVFAALQILLVSFAGPIATLSIQDRDGTSRRRLAATLAMVLALPQANVVFPMAAAGLNIGPVILIALVGGLVASSLTYYVFTRSFGTETDSLSVPPAAKAHTSLWGLLVGGGQEAVQIVLNAIPPLLLAIFLVNLLKYVGAIGLVEQALAPLFHLLGLSPAAVLPLASKVLAGGTAMMGITLELLKDGAISLQEFHRLAGFLINPLDLVGVSILAAAGPRVTGVARAAILGAAIGVLVRGILHLLLF